MDVDWTLLRQDKRVASRVAIVLGLMHSFFALTILNTFNAVMVR